MPANDAGGPFWKRLPRWAFWVTGAAIAFLGGYVANVVSADLPLNARFPIWILGSAVIFAGLCIVALGTRAHLGRGERKDDGA